MDESELAELTGLTGEAKPKFKAVDILRIARSIVEAVQKNDAGLSQSGIVNGVAERIAGFVATSLSSPNAPDSSAFTIRRPTKPGWYWVRTLGGKRVVQVTPSGANRAMHAADMGDVSELPGVKWFGPIEEPK